VLCIRNQELVVPLLGWLVGWLVAVPQQCTVTSEPPGTDTVARCTGCRSPFFGFLLNPQNYCILRGGARALGNGV
jgi:hypothetical protein